VRDDRQRAESRALLEGPTRAPARSYLRNIGYTERQLRQGALAVLYGNLAPEGSVTKTGPHGPRSHRGPARVFECEEDAIEAVLPGRQLEIEGVDLAARPRPGREPYQRLGALAHYALLVGSASLGAVLAGLDDTDDTDDRQAGA
jgi:hypothetical protein